MLAPAFRASIARLIRALLHFGLVLRDSDSDIVNCHFVRLRGAAVDVFQTRRMPVPTPRFVQFAILLLDAAGRAAATFLLAWFQ